MERLALSARVLGQCNLPASPAGELLAYLLEAPRTLEAVRALGVPLAQALEVLEAHPLGQGLIVRGQTLHWIGESDLGDYKQAVARGELEPAWRRYSLLLPGVQSPLPEWMGWLEAERIALLAGLLDLALPYLAKAHALAEAELAHPQDKTRALAACLLQAEANLRKGQGKQAVVILGQALGLQEHMAQAFSALSLALLAEAQALWNHPQKAQQTALKALERSSDPYSRSRAHFALYRAKHNPTDLQAALREALGYPHWQEYLKSVGSGHL